MEDRLKKEWRETNFRGIDTADLEGIREGKRRTALQSLARRYRWFSNFALVMIFMVPLMTLGNVLPMGTERIWLLAGFAVYFATCSIMDYWMYHGVSQIDCATMAVSEVAERAAFYRKRHLQFVMILLPMAILLIAGMGLYCGGDIYMVLGIIVGAMFGLAIGTRQLLRFLAAYRDLTTD